MGTQDGDERIAGLEDEAVVEGLVEPAADHTLQDGEIDHHALSVQGRSFEGDENPAIVPVQVPALALVLEQAVAIAERQLARHPEHDLLSFLPLLYHTSVPRRLGLLADSRSPSWTPWSRSRASSAAMNRWRRTRFCAWADRPRCWPSRAVARNWPASSGPATGTVSLCASWAAG